MPNHGLDTSFLGEDVLGNQPLPGVLYAGAGLRPLWKEIRFDRSKSLD